jgi:hypothetical protein
MIYCKRNYIFCSFLQAEYNDRKCLNSVADVLPETTILYRTIRILFISSKNNPNINPYIFRAKMLRDLSSRIVSIYSTSFCVCKIINCYMNIKLVRITE